MKATLLDLAAERGEVLDLRVGNDGDVAVPLTMLNPPREVVLGRRYDKRDEYCAFLIFADDDDHTEAWNRSHETTGNLSPTERLLREIFSKVIIEPELPFEICAVEGGRVVRVDLAEQWRDHVLLVPEALIP